MGRKESNQTKTKEKTHIVISGPEVIKKFHMQLNTTCESLKASKKSSFFHHFSFYELLKFHAQLS